MRKLTFLLLLFLSAAAHAQQPAAQANPDSLQVNWADVTRFWLVYDQLAQARTRADSLRLVDTGYLAPASPGLRAYAAAANATAADFLRAWSAHRRYLAALRGSSQALGAQRPALRKAARQLQRIYPAATFPAVYFAIGKFEVGGTQFDNALFIGAELKAAPPRPPLAELRPELRAGVSPVGAVSTSVIHEIIHAQQQLTNTPTNLAGALREGAAEYLAFRLTGRLGAEEALRYGRQNEAAVRRQFAAVADKPIEARWFLATADPATGQPGALAYFIGFRICEAYYQQAPDKPAALRQLMALSNASELLAFGRAWLTGPAR